MWQKKRGAALIGICAGIYAAIAFVNPYQGVIGLGELVLQLSGSRGEFCLGNDLTELVRYMLCMVPNYIVMMIYGSDLYGHFCTASIYVFSRCTNRLVWYGKTLASLLAKICVYETAFLCTVIAVTILRYQVTVSVSGLLLLGVHAVIYIMWIYAWVLFINLCAIKTGSSPAFMAAMVVQVVCTAALSLIRVMELNEASRDSIEFLVNLNPIAHTVLGWHGSAVLAEELAWSRYSLSLPCSVGLMILLCVMILAVGAVLVQKHDLLVEDIELGTA